MVTCGGTADNPGYKSTLAWLIEPIKSQTKEAFKVEFVFLADYDHHAYIHVSGIGTESDVIQVNRGGSWCLSVCLASTQPCGRLGSYRCGRPGPGIS